MIIQCPACSSRYRIQEDKLPEAGGNIRCPNCAHIFFVSRDGTASAAVRPADGPADSPAPAPAETAALPDPFDDSPAEPTPAAPAATGARRWKLRNPVGLIYDFPETDQLRRWLSTRDSFDGIKVSSNGGGTWQDVTEVEELADLRATGRKAIGGGGPVTIPRMTGSNPRVTGPHPATGTVTGPLTATSAERMREEAEARLREARVSRQSQAPTDPPVEFRYIKPAANEHEAKASRLLLLLAMAILPLAAVVGLHLVGVIDLRDWGVLPPARTNTPATTVAAAPAPDEGSEASAAVEMTPQQAVALLISQAAAAQSRRDWDGAADMLERAISVMPDDSELYCLIEPVYVQVGRAADAANARQRCRPPAAEGSADGSGATGEGAAPAPTTP